MLANSMFTQHTTPSGSITRKHVRWNHPQNRRLRATARFHEVWYLKVLYVLSLLILCYFSLASAYPIPIPIFTSFPYSRILPNVFHKIRIQISPIKKQEFSLAKLRQVHQTFMLPAVPGCSFLLMARPQLTEYFTDLCL